MSDTFRTGDAFFAYDADLEVIAWNGAAERLTGIPADEAVGRPCWDVMRGVSERGDIVCHPGCSNARLAREGFPVSCSRMLIPAPGGRKLISVSTISVSRVGEGPVVLNLLRNGSAPVPAEEDAERLTARQTEILRRLAAGEPVKTIAARLGIAETTTRNHVAAILHRLDCHSQLEAVAKARRLQLL